MGNAASTSIYSSRRSKRLTRLLHHLQPCARPGSSDPSLQYTTPQSSYPPTLWSPDAVRRLILRGRLAPCYPGADDHSIDTPENCPICLNYFPALNKTKCCDQGICTDCFLQVRPPRHRNEVIREEDRHMQMMISGIDGMGPELLEMFGRRRVGADHQRLRGRRAREKTEAMCPFCKLKRIEVVFDGKRGISEIEKELKEKEDINRRLDERRAAGRSSTAGEDDAARRNARTKQAKESKEKTVSQKKRIDHSKKTPKKNDDAAPKAQENERDSRRHHEGVHRPRSNRAYTAPHHVRPGRQQRNTVPSREVVEEREMEEYTGIRTQQWVRSLQVQQSDESDDGDRSISMPVLRLNRRPEVERRDMRARNDASTRHRNAEGRRSGRGSSAGVRHNRRRVYRDRGGRDYRSSRFTTRESLDSDSRETDDAVLRAVIQRSLFVQ